MYEKYFKRLLDIILSGVALIVLAPVLIIVAIFVRIKLGSPVLFKQERPGKNEKIFNMYKFRSMTDSTDGEGKLLPDSERLPQFGKTLRSTSLDELPELWNILKGDMSIVGPRPLAVQYLPYYTKEEAKRHTVRPGLTGLSQVNGRNSVTWEERFRNDLKYINNITLYNDIMIVYQTIIIALKRSDIGERGKGNLIDFDVHRKNKVGNK